MNKQSKEEIDDKGCDTCMHFDSMEGVCEKGLAGQFQCRSCDTSGCPEYKLDPFYADLGDEE